MMRSEDYNELSGIPPYPNLLFADFELWIKLTGKSYKATAAQEGFYFRLHQSTTSVSADERYLYAFEKFINFLSELRLNSATYRQVITDNANKFLLHYCKSMSHRLLRTPKEKRENLSVNLIIEKVKIFSNLLTSAKNFNPRSIFTIGIAKIIDSNKITRDLFLLFKKSYNKPLLK